MISLTEALSLFLVGSLWGCTNPFMRKGFAESSADATKDDATTNNEGDATKELSGISRSKAILKSISQLTRIKVWLPYSINQLGSLLYYKSLASSNLTLSVPICNATAMVFSSITSILLGERVNQPGKAMLGVSFVLLGVGICMYSSEDEIAVGVVDGVKAVNTHAEL
mmetsp:Transcript_18584/g.40237  ORF Transcript_18584/g.40237 Transcript_18584/m.40237 type:complete len:168 (+) Transcript_18584:468-971(+)